MPNWNINTTTNEGGTNDYTLTITLRHEDSVRLLHEADVSPEHADEFAKGVLQAFADNNLQEEIDYFLWEMFPTACEEECEEDDVAPDSEEKPVAEEPGKWKPLPTWKGEIDGLYDEEYCCPRCGSDDIDWAKDADWDGEFDDGEVAYACQCRRCGQDWFADHRLYLSFNGIRF